MSKTDDVIAALRREIRRLGRELPPIELRPEEVRPLLGQLFAEAPGLVLLLSQALGRYPQLFPVHAPRGRELQECQQEAFALLGLESLLEKLLKRVRHGRLRKEQQALELALLVLEQIQMDDQLWHSFLAREPLADPDFFRTQVLPRFLRQSVLLPVRRLLFQHRARCRPRKLGPPRRERPGAYRKALTRSELTRRFQEDLAEARREFAGRGREKL